MTKVSKQITFSQKVVTWYQTHGRRNLPWQLSTGEVKPYHVWLSEIMLQQTQVIKVKEYFNRFIKALPTLKDLAEADEQQVLSLWSGLGYYNRARNLHKAAQICQQHHQGKLPKKLQQLIDLPGIGRSTAAAIMSLAYDEAEPIMDGNVKRVFARHFLVAGEPNKSSTLKKFWQLAELNRELDQPAFYTQGLMDLGAMICTKHQPKCEQCPVQSSCLAKAKGVIEKYPEKKQKVVQKTMNLYCLLYHKQGKIALQLRNDEGIWPKLWFLPTFHSETALVKKHQWAQLQFSLTHKLTHRILHIHVYGVNSNVVHKNWQMVTQNELPNKPHPKALNHILNQYENHQLH